MDVIGGYIKSMVPYMIISMPVFMLVRYISYKRRNKLNIKHEILLFIFYLFLVGLLSQTLLPINNGKNRINLIPFKIFFDTYTEFLNGNVYYFIISFLGNIIMFIPIGLFIPLLYKIKDKYVILIGFSISLFIEFFQIFLPRETDVDDLILNTFGTFIGLLIYKLLYKICNNKLDVFKSKINC